MNIRNGGPLHYNDEPLSAVTSGILRSLASTRYRQS